MEKACAIGALLLCVLVQTCLCASPGRTARTAKKFKGSETWLWRTELPGLAPKETDKCHMFVAHALRKAGAPAPNRDPPKFSPIGVAEWMDTSHIKRCWQLCDSPPMIGDVIVMYKHMGIVTDDGLTTRSSFNDLPLGIIVEDDWGFREGQMPICWRYKYGQFTCFSFLGRW